MDYGLKKQVEEYGLTDAKLIQLCYDNFFQSKITVTEYRDKKDRMLGFSTKDGLVTAMLGAPKTNAQFSKMLQSDHIIVAIAC